MKTRGYTVKSPRSGAAKRLHRQKPLILAFCVVFSIVIVLGSTIAWFTTADTRVNNIRREDIAGNFSITLLDDFNPIPENGKYSKSVGAVNAGTSPGFVRLLVIPVFVIQGEDGDPDTLLPAEWDTHVFIDDLNTDDWIEGGDGYFYYIHRLESGESTATVDTVTGKDHNLFNTVSLPAQTPQGYENATLKIEVKCEAVDIEKWNYRIGWWGNAAAPEADALIEVDNALQALAQ